MAYIDASDLRTYLKITSESDDTLMTTLISSAQKRINEICHRTFEASDDSIRYFDIYRDVKGRTVFFDTDLIAITSLEIDNETIPATEYYLEPRNIKPAWGLSLRFNSTHLWTYTSTIEYTIKITGKWAYSETAPADIQHACKRLAGFYYKEKGAQVFETLGNDKTGQMQLPASEPSSVRMILKPYIRSYQRARY